MLAVVVGMICKSGREFRVLPDVHFRGRFSVGHCFLSAEYKDGTPSDFGPAPASSFPTSR